MSEQKKNHLYITLTKVGCFIASIILSVFGASETWSKSSYDNTSEKFLYLALFLMVAFPVFGMIAYFMLLKSNPDKAKAYRNAAIIEFALLFLLITYVGNIGR